ncbi:MAG: multicopper oxidase domain-containing protein [Sandaracinaceae bacterium]
MSRRVALCAAAAASVLAAGCFSSAGAVRDVATDVRERTGRPIRLEDRAPGRSATLEQLAERRLRRPLDAEGAVEVALAQSPRLQGELESLDVALADLLQASLVENPTVDFDVHFFTDSGTDQVADLGGSFVVDLADVIRMPIRRSVGMFPRSARQPATTVIVPTGSCRVIEFVADAPGDWAMHCHMTHHVMNQMGHDVPNMVGADVQRFDRRVRRLVPGYMTMGQNGMAAMGEMEMPVPENSIPMRGGPGAFGNIDMGGMFTILKVRENLTSYDDPGWFENPPGTVARRATPGELEADGIDS